MKTLSPPLKPRLEPRAIIALCWIFLLPLSFLWAVATSLRRRLYPKKARFKSKCRVICVGNIHSGGSGKTPLVVELCERLASRKPVVVSRGYKGHFLSTVSSVDLSEPEGAVKYGDEPWLIARRTRAPVYVGANRTRVIQQVEHDLGSRLVILDDGFQHLALGRDLDLVAISTGHAPSDAFCLPLGHLREPFSSLRYCDAVILVQNGGELSGESWRQLLTQVAPEIPVFAARKIVSGLWDGETVSDMRLSHAPGCFCGIARPAAFLEDVTARWGMSFSSVYPDHYRYHRSDLEWLSSRAKALGSEVLVTTEKDWYKVRNLCFNPGVQLLALRIRYELATEFWSFMETRLGN